MLLKLLMGETTINSFVHHQIYALWTGVQAIHLTTKSKKQYPGQAKHSSCFFKGKTGIQGLI